MSLAYWVPQPVMAAVPVGMIPLSSGGAPLSSGQTPWPQFMQIVGVAAVAGMSVGTTSGYTTEFVDGVSGSAGGPNGFASDFVGGVSNGVAGVAQGVAAFVLGGGAAWGGSGIGGNARRSGRQQRRQGGTDGPGQSGEFKSHSEQRAPFAPQSEKDDQTIRDATDDELSDKEAMDTEDLVQGASSALGQQVLAQLQDGGEDSRRAALASLQGSVAMLSFDSVGCLAVQRALEVADQKQAGEIISELHGHVLEASKSMYANYVIQKVVETMPISAVGFVLEELQGIGAEVAKHRYGCRIICRLLEHSSAEPIAQKMIEELVADTRELSRHAYGYHVLRSILEHGLPDHRHRIASALLRGDVARLAKNRSASFVIEKALEFCDTEDRNALANSVVRKPGSVAALAKHQFGRHVVRELLKVPGAPSQKTRDDLRLADSFIRSCKHGRRCIAELQPLLTDKMA